MRRLSTIALLAASAMLFVLSAAGAPSPTRPTPQTLLTEGGLIHAFAQDAGAVAWIGPGYLVHVRRIGAVAGDGSTLVFGEILQRCDIEWNCQRIDVTGAVRHATDGATAIAGLPAPFLLATSGGRIALVPAKTPRFFPDIGPPRAAEYAPVQVYGPDGHLISSFVPDGTPRAIALAWPKLALLFEFVDGSRRIELRDARTGGYWNVGGEASFTKVPVTVRGVAVGTPGAVYAVGSAIYVLRAQKPQLVARAAGAPIGLSIEGRRIAWAENVRGKGRIRSLTLR
jgi:hypothetical protein